MAVDMTPRTYLLALPANYAAVKPTRGFTRLYKLTIRAKNMLSIGTLEFAWTAT